MENLILARMVPGEGALHRAVAPETGFALSVGRWNARMYGAARANTETRIRNKLPVAGNVGLVVYDLLGRRVATLVNERMAAGSYEVSFNVARPSR